MKRNARWNSEIPRMTFVPYPYEKYTGLSLSLSLAYRDWCSAPRYFGGILYTDSTVEEAGPTKTLCQQVGTTPCFHVASFIEIFFWNGLADATLLLGFPFLLTSHRFIYPSEGIWRMHFTYRYCPPLCTKLAGSIRVVVATVTSPTLKRVWSEFQ